MSSDEAAGGAPGREPATRMILRAGSAFDGRDRVLRVAAYELLCRATADSVVHGHAGFVPDEYLAGLGAGTAASAAGLCAAGMWERAGGGYRVLDQEAVDVCLERLRELREGGPRVRRG